MTADSMAISAGSAADGGDGRDGDGDSAAVYASRRSELLTRLGGTGALVLAAAPELHIGPDTGVRYVPDADLYYLTGYTEPEAALVLCPSAEAPFTLFVRDRDPERERWSGVRGGVAAARDRFRADAAWPIGELRERLPKLVAGASTIFAHVRTGRPAVDDALRTAFDDARRSRPRTGRGVHTVTEPSLLLGPMRRRKDAHEISLLREAAAVTVAGFEAAHHAILTARGEWQVEAALEHAFRERGAMGPAFPSIVAGGANATVLHYTANDAPLRPGSLLLIDAGARCGMYCGDVTRTYPVGGSFSGAQREVWDLVQRAHAAALAAVAPGRSAEDPHDAAVRVLVDGMIGLGLLQGNAAELVEQNAHKRYFPHRTSHWLGLDVHDAGDYVAADGRPVALEAGMVLTVEPGLYIPLDDDAAPAALRGLGVRLEDDVLVTPTGCEVLTSAAPA
jgi:Xaa-Pro aminopeptidase